MAQPRQLSWSSPLSRGRAAHPLLSSVLPGSGAPASSRPALLSALPVPGIQAVPLGPNPPAEGCIS